MTYTLSTFARTQGAKDKQERKKKGSIENKVAIGSGLAAGGLGYGANKLDRIGLNNLNVAKKLKDKGSKQLAKEAGQVGIKYLKGGMAAKAGAIGLGALAGGAYIKKKMKERDEKNNTLKNTLKDKINILKSKFTK